MALGEPSPLNVMIGSNDWERWFLGQTTIGNDAFRLLSTIGPTLEWLSTIVQV